MGAKAVDVFQATHERAETLCNLHGTGKAGRPKKEKEDILWSAVILEVAGVDACFHDRILGRLTPFLKSRKGQNLPGGLVKVLEDGGGASKLLGIMYKAPPHRQIDELVYSLYGLSHEEIAIAEGRD